MNRKNYPDEVKEIDELDKSVRNCLITFVVLAFLGFLIHVFDRLTVWAIILYILANIFFWLSIIFKFIQIRLKDELANKRMNAMVSEINELKKTKTN